MFSFAPPRSSTRRHMLEPVSAEAVLPDRALCLPTFSHFLIVNKISLPPSLLPLFAFFKFPASCPPLPLFLPLSGLIPVSPFSSSSVLAWCRFYIVTNFSEFLVLVHSRLRCCRVAGCGLIRWEGEGDERCENDHARGERHRFSSG